MRVPLRLLYLAALPITFALAVCSPVTRTFVSTSSGDAGGFGPGGVGGFGLGGAGGFGPGGGAGTGGCDGGSCVVCPAGETACTSGCSMLDTDTDCGACGHACGAGSTCSTGFCTPVTVCTGLGSSGALALFGGNAYTAAGQSVPMCSLATTGGTSVNLWHTGLLFVQATTVAADPKSLYFVTHSSFSPSNPTDALDQSDGMAGSFTDVDDYPAPWPSSYVTTLDDPSTGNVFAVLQTSVEQVLLSQATDAGVPAHTCLSVGTSAVITSASAGGGKLFVASSAAGTVVGATVTGTTCTTATTLASGLSMPGAVATDGTTVAFADASGVYACNAALGCVPEATPTPLVTGQGTVSGIVMDTAATPNLYWIGSSGLVTCSSEASQCKGKATVLVPNATPTSALAVDATYVYYVQGNVLSRVAR